MNFNFNDSIFYSQILKQTTNEYISLYGIKAKWIVPTIRKIDEIIGENYINLKDECVEVCLLPENSESYNNEASYNQLGLQNMENLVCYISEQELNKVHPNFINMIGQGFDNMIGDVILFQSGKILELSNISCNIGSGLNHLFTYQDKKNVFKLTLVTYLPNKTELVGIKNSEQPQILPLKNVLDIFDIDNKNTKVIEQTNKSLQYDKTNDDYNKKFGGFE